MHRFKPGDPKPEGSGIKKGQKQARTQFRDRLEKKFGRKLPEALGEMLDRAWEAGDWAEVTELLKVALPYCYKKQPTMIAGSDDPNDEKLVVEVRKFTIAQTVDDTE